VRRRAVITGVGVMTPLGHTLEMTTDAIAAGRTAIGPASLFDASGFPSGDAAEITDWDPRPSFRMPKALKLADRPARFAVASARMALEAAAYPRTGRSFADLGVAIGSSGSDLQARDLVRALASPNGAPGWRVDDIAAFADRMLNGLNPLWLLVSLPNMTSAHVAIQVEAQGPNTTIMSDWTAGHQAIGEAALWIEMNETDAALAGGADCGVHPFAFVAYDQAGLLPNGDRHGLVPSEGAALFVLEAAECAAARGTPARGEIQGYATATSSGDCGATALHDALAAALDDAGWSAKEVDVCGITRPAGPAHDRLGDVVCSLFGGRLRPIDFSRSIGFALAAAAPIELAVLMGMYPSAKVLSGCVGSSGEAAALAIETTPPNGTHAS
jgi:3-oxoacyl-[acyl-carrier-protein] synthase II